MDKWVTTPSGRKVELNEVLRDGGAERGTTFGIQINIRIMTLTNESVKKVSNKTK